MKFTCFCTILIVQFFGTTRSNITLSTQDPGPICSPSIALNCSHDNTVTNVRVRERKAGQTTDNVLTSNTIQSRSGYNELRSDGLYTLMINQLEGHNCSVYRCAGFENSTMLDKVYSNEWKLIIASDDSCASKVNDTVVNANSTTDVKYNQTDNGTADVVPSGTVSTTSSTVLPTKPTVETDTGAVIGGVFGGLLLLIFVIILVIVVLCVGKSCVKTGSDGRVEAEMQDH